MQCKALLSTKQICWVLSKFLLCAKQALWLVLSKFWANFANFSTKQFCSKLVKKIFPWKNFFFWAAIMLSNLLSKLCNIESRAKWPLEQDQEATALIPLHNQNFFYFEVLQKKTIAPIVHPCNRVSEITTKWAWEILSIHCSSERGCKHWKLDGALFNTNISWKKQPHVCVCVCVNPSLLPQLGKYSTH